MELENKIYNDFCNQEECYYDEAQIISKVLEYESLLKAALKKPELILFEKLQLERLNLQKLESLRLIEFVLNNYAENYKNKKA